MVVAIKTAIGPPTSILGLNIASSSLKHGFKVDHLKNIDYHFMKELSQIEKSIVILSKNKMLFRNYY